MSRRKSLVGGASSSDHTFEGATVEAGPQEASGAQLDSATIDGATGPWTRSMSRRRRQRERREGKAEAVVEHDIDRKRFTLDLSDYDGLARGTRKRVAYIAYRLSWSESNEETGKQQQQRVMELYHSEVPKELRGKGYGKRLAEGTFERLAEFRAQGKCANRIRITCSYLRDYMDRFASDAHKSLLVGAGCKREEEAEEKEERTK